MSTSTLLRPPVTEVATASRWRTWPDAAEWRFALVAVAVTRVVTLTIAGAAARMRTDVALDEGWLAIWRRWDADIYATIAERGYAGPGSEPFSEAFPPTWPLLLRAGAAVGLSPTATAMLLTAVATVIAVAFLVRWVDETVAADTRATVATGGLTAGRGAAMVLLVFPTAVFLVAGYTEAMFLAGAIPAFRAARNGRWGAAVAFPLAVAVAARWTGLFLAVALGVELLRQRPPLRVLATGAAAVAAGLAPAVAYSTWLLRVHGDALYFLVAQTQGWGRRFVGPVESFRATWNAAAGGGPLVVAWRAELVAAAIGVGAVAVLVRRREWAAVVYTGALLGALMTSTWYYSLPRILLTVFPLFLLLGRWTGRRRGRLELLLVASAPLAALGVLTFTRGAWFH